MSLTEPYDSQKIWPLLGHCAIGQLVIVDETTSTNDYVKTLKAEEPVICLAERQLQGRGRRGKQWLSDTSAITFSVMFYFKRPIEQLMGISLAIGVGVARELEALGVSQLCLKWPNDLWIENKKVGGILIETAIRNDQVQVVIGVGLNTANYPKDKVIGQEATSLGSHLDNQVTLINNQMTLSSPKVSRNTLAAAAIKGVLDSIEVFGEQGLSPFLDEWQARDALNAKQIKIQRGEQQFIGEYQGIDSDGKLRADIAGESVVFDAGEVSIRHANTVN